MKLEKHDKKNSPEEFAEKFAGNLPETLQKKSTQIALQNLGIDRMPTCKSLRTVTFCWKTTETTISTRLVDDVRPTDPIACARLSDFLFLVHGVAQWSCGEGVYDKGHVQKFGFVLLFLA